jgi:hypothetical protein
MFHEELNVIRILYQFLGKDVQFGVYVKVWFQLEEEK